MKALARILRFLFGLQALKLVLIIPAILWLPRVFLRLAAAGAKNIVIHAGIVVLSALLFDIVFAGAWWKLRKGHSDARWWAMAASVLSLPIPVPGIVEPALRIARSWNVFGAILYLPPQFIELAVGMTGLAVFSRPNAIENSRDEPKPPHVDGDGTSKYWEYALQGLVIVGMIGALFWWPRWSASHGLRAPTHDFAVIFLALFSEILGHELGHFAAGSLVGRKLRRLHVGPFQWAMRNGRWRFEFAPSQSLGGSVAMVPATLEHYRRQTAISIAGGPLASLTMGVAGLVAVLNAKGSAWEPAWYLFAMMATVSSLSFVANLIPTRTKLFFSDGAQMYQVLSNGPWAKVHLTSGMVASSVVSATRPRDWDISLIDTALETVKQGPEAFLYHLFAAYYYLDTGHVAEALDNVKAAESRFTPKAMPKPADLYADFVYYNAFYGRDLPAAEGWWEKLEALPKIDRDADYWRARASLLWLRGELHDARHAWERGNELAHKLPAFGMYDFTRSQFAALRKVLDAVPPEVRPPGAADPVITNPQGRY